MPIRGRYSPFNLTAFNQKLNHGLLLGLAGQGVGGGADDHELGSNDSPTFAGATITGCSVLGLNSAVFQPTANDPNFGQWLDAAGLSILNLDSTNRQVTIGQTSATYPFLIKSTDGSDQISIYHDNVNAHTKWNDGHYFLETDEGTNSNSIVRIRGKGTGRGILEAYDQDNAEFIQITCNSGIAQMQVLGTTPISMDFAPSASTGVRLFINSSEGETRELEIFGFGTGSGGKESLDISVEQYAANTAEFFGTDAYMFNGNLITLNTTHSDADEARKTSHDFKGEQSGGEQTTLARIEAGHDGSADDEKGYLDIFINDGDDGDSPTHMVRVNSIGLGVGTKTQVSLLEVDGAEGLAIETVTGNTTLDTTHSTVLVNANGNVTITLPTAASAYNSTDGIGRIYEIKKIDADADTVTIDPDGAELIDGGATAILTVQYESITVQTDGSNWHII